MAIGWITVLQSVPWTEVVRNAPKVAAGAKKLWGTLATRKGESAASSVLDTAVPTEPMTLAEMQDRLGLLQEGTAELKQRLIESTSLIDALAEQNTQLIATTEALGRRLRWLTALVILLGVAGGVAFWSN
jgi:hypothetical protein